MKKSFTQQSLFRKIKPVSLASASLLMSFLCSAQASADTIFSESFDSGLGSFTGNGRVYTGSYGVRLRGSASSAITSSNLDLNDYTSISLSYEAQTSGLDSGESFDVSYSVNDGSFITLESTNSVSGQRSFNLPSSVDGQTIQLRFSLNASSFFETIVLDDINVSGSAGEGGGNGGGDNTGSLPPVDRVDINGPFQVEIEENTGPAGEGWVAHPSEFGVDNLKHPIFIWGPGAGTGPEDYAFFLDRVASHGFVIYSEVSTGDGDEMVDALDWLIAENNRPGSIYYQKLDIEKVAFGGHSRGSLSTFGVANDNRLTTTVHVAGGSFDGDGPDNLRKPALYVGGTEDFATSNMESDYLNTDVPVFFTVLDGVDHIMATREGQPVIVDWLRWQLGNEDFREDNFINQYCLYCSGTYDSVYKNW